MTQLFANNAKSTLASGISNSDTSIVVATGQGALFPSPTGGNHATLTLTQVGVESSWEIVRLTARSGDTLTVVRAQEGTSAAAWSAGDKIELRFTAGSDKTPTGVGHEFFGTTAPDGWILASGRTIGNASSGATERANLDTEALFTLLWNSMTNTEAPVSGGRGASAAADYAANKTITLPDERGRVVVGKDNMGGTTASRITSGGSGINGTTLGASGGSETHTLTTAQMPVHNHTDAGHTHGQQYNTVLNLNGGSYPGNTSGTGAGGGTTNTGYASIGNSGSGNSHQNTQPSIVANKIIKL